MRCIGEDVIFFNLKFCEGGEIISRRLEKLCCKDSNVLQTAEKAEVPDGGFFMRRREV